MKYGRVNVFKVKIDGELNILLKMRVTYSCPYVFLILSTFSFFYAKSKNRKQKYK